MISKTPIIFKEKLGVHSHTFYTLKRPNAETIKNIRIEAHIPIITPNEKLTVISDEQANRIFSIIAHEIGGKDQDTIILLTIIAQRGGANAKAKVIHAYDKIETSSEFILKCVKQICPEGTVRQLFKSIRNVIADYAKILQLEGDLGRQIRKDIPDITMEESVWASTFQTGNPDVPTRIKTWLANDRRTRTLKNKKIIIYAST